MHVPLVQNIGRPVALFNRGFSQSDPRAGWKPDYWDVQALASHSQLAGLPSITRLLQRSTEPQSWQINAAPGAVVDLRQRVALEPGRYLLKVGLDFDGYDAASVLTIRTRPAAPGPQPWTPVANIEAAGFGSQNNEYSLRLEGPAAGRFRAGRPPVGVHPALGRAIPLAPTPSPYPL